MDAPLLLKISEEDLNGVNFDPLRIAEKELDAGVLPITVNQPMPERKETDITKVKLEEKTISDAEKEKAEAEEEKEIQESGEIMEIATESEEEAQEVEASHQTTEQSQELA